MEMIEPVKIDNMTDVDKRSNRLIISTLDFDRCKDFLLEIEKHEYGSLISEALLLSAIIAYARPFSNNERKGATESEARLNVDELQFDEQEKELHDRIVKLRKKAVAHSEWKYHPARVVDNGQITAGIFQIFMYFHRIDIARFLDLSNKLLKQVHNLCADTIRRKRLHK